MTMIQSRTSRAYARALYGASLEQQCLEPVSADMIGIEKAVRSSIPMSRFLRDYSVGRQSRGRALDRFFQSRVSPLTSRFLEFLEQRRRMGILPGICESFLELCRKMAGIRKVRLVSALPMDEGQAIELTALIRKRVGAPMELVTDVKPALGGGFTVQVEDTLYDWSVAGALRVLRQKLGAGKG